MDSLYLQYQNIQSMDLSKVNQLIQLGKDLQEDVLSQLLQTHIETSEQILQDMKSYLKASLYDDLKRCAHKFKSSSANLGLVKLNAFCVDLENELKLAVHVDGILRKKIESLVNCIQHENKISQDLLRQQVQSSKVAV